MITPAPSPMIAKPALDGLDLLARRATMRLLQNLSGGHLTIHEGRQTQEVGEPASDGLHVHMTIHDARAWRLMLAGGSNGAAEAYIQGLWDTDDLTGLVRLLLRNRDQLDAMETGFASMAGWIARLWHSLNRNTRTGSHRNIAAHYDLGNDFFELFLDPSLMYSSAIYQHDDESLETASERKLETICRKLELSAADHLLEIGTGWGGMALYAAKHFGCRVTTTTISQEQYDAACARVQAAGLEDRITVLKEDYRDLTGKYDKVVSIEMVEAVGHHYLDDYFNQIAHLLKADGLCLIQAITIEDHRYQMALNSVDFIKRYIFPGSFIPCVSVLSTSAAKARLRVFNLEDIGPSYALTLRAWRTRFEQQLEAVAAQGFDERFMRMWRFYLCYCEGGFLERSVSDVQLLFVKSANRRPQWTANVQQRLRSA